MRRLASPADEGPALARSSALQGSLRACNACGSTGLVTWRAAHDCGAVLATRRKASVKKSQTVSMSGRSEPGRSSSRGRNNM